MATTYLIIAHLLADFSLQSNRLVAWKTKQFKGVVIHVCIFSAVALLILFPYLIHWETWAIIGAVSVFHLIVDQAKINIALRRDAYVLPFITDQALHFLSLIVGGYYLDTLPFTLPDNFFFNEIYTNIIVIVIILALIFAGYIIDIIYFQEDRSKKKIITKILSFTAIYILYMAAALLIK